MVNIGKPYARTASFSAHSLSWASASVGRSWILMEYCYSIQEFKSRCWNDWWAINKNEPWTCSSSGWWNTAERSWQIFPERTFIEANDEMQLWPRGPQWRITNATNATNAPWISMDGIYKQGGHCTWSRTSPREAALSPQISQQKESMALQSMIPIYYQYIYIYTVTTFKYMDF